jgi:F1F0 ATPase subunit 2
MSEFPGLLVALLAGVLLGMVFFGGLWWTIRRALASGRPAAWFLGSLVVRAAVALSGFFLVARGDWRRLLASLLGFLLARLFVTHFVRGPAETKAGVIREGGP